jgi:glycolate oxidase/D-lactate dehydrogenase
MGLFMSSNQVIKALKKGLGSSKVFYSQEYLLTYAYDATGSEYAVPPDVVVFPQGEEDVAAVLAVARRYKVPVTPRGAGVGYSGGSIPVRGGIALVFTKMNRILQVDEDNLLAVVEPGVVTHDLQQEVEKRGLFYPVDPASLKTSTIGGNVAENAGGPRCFKYGVTANYVLALEAYLITGEKVVSGSYVIKDVAGYNLKSLLVGSEGTLAVITRITLKLLPRPQCRILARLDFDSLSRGTRFVHRVIRGNLGPSVLEFMDQSAITAVCQYLELPLEPEIKASFLVEIDGNPLDVKERKERLLSMVADEGVITWQMAENELDQDKLWHLRRNISPAIARLRPRKINEDIVVPISKIPDAVSHITELARQSDILVSLFGHIGDGNIHTNLMVDPEDKDELARADVLLEKIFRYVVQIKGSITGEHGVGLTKQDYLPLQFKHGEVELFRRIKKAFDPDNLLNPGKMYAHRGD